ncbi:MAG TPA: hypothetical protein VGL02_13035, partial [Streptomyces sp.]
LGCCSYGGIYEEGSNLSDERGFRRDVMEAARPLRFPVLRWPGGNFVSGCHWLDGVREVNGLDVGATNSFEDPRRVDVSPGARHRPPGRARPRLPRPLHHDPAPDRAVATFRCECGQGWPLF